MELFSFEKLEVYNQALSLVCKVYKLCDRFPEHEKYSLYKQLHRCIVSVPSNIAESSGRKSYKEKIHFIEIAYGSLMEAYCQLQIAYMVGYLTPEELTWIKPYFFSISRQLNALSNSYTKKLNPTPN